VTKVGTGVEHLEPVYGRERLPWSQDGGRKEHVWSSAPHLASSGWRVHSQEGLEVEASLDRGLEIGRRERGRRGAQDGLEVRRPPQGIRAERDTWIRCRESSGGKEEQVGRVESRNGRKSSCETAGNGGAGREQLRTWHILSLEPSDLGGGAWKKTRETGHRCRTCGVPGRLLKTTSTSPDGAARGGSGAWGVTPRQVCCAPWWSCPKPPNLQPLWG
jgi:hypothetical protein